MSCHGPQPSRVRPRRGLLALAWGLLLCAPGVGVPTAHAYHNEHNRSLEESAYLLRPGEWELGLLVLGVGIGPLQLSTRTAPWIIGAIKRKVVPNLTLDGTVVDRRGVTLSARAGLFFINSNKLSDDDTLVRLFVIPLGTSLSWRINERHTTSLMLKYVRLTTDADADEDDVNVEGTALADNAQVHASWEWRLNKVTALLCVVRYLPYQADPIFHSEATLDERTSAQVAGQADTENLQHSVAGAVSTVLSWKHFNLRAGLAYGALFMPGVGLVLPMTYPYPEFNFYWRI